MNSNPNSLWSKFPESVDMLKALHAEGRSNGQIAFELNVKLHLGISRNAVIGKVNRLGLSKPQVKHTRKQQMAGKRNGGAALAAIKSRVNGQGVINGLVLKRDNKAFQASTPQTATRPTMPTATAFIVTHRQGVLLADLKKVKVKDKRGKDKWVEMCRWPIGNPMARAEWFCGVPVEQDRPYCPCHTAIAMRPVGSLWVKEAA